MGATHTQSIATPWKLQRGFPFHHHQGQHHTTNMSDPGLCHAFQPVTPQRTLDNGPFTFMQTPVIPVHEPPGYRCGLPRCGKVLRTANSRVNHWSTIHGTGAVTGRPYKCAKCKWAFDSHTDRGRHHKLQKRRMPTCKVRGYQFSGKGARLKAHMERHEAGHKGYRFTVEDVQPSAIHVNDFSSPPSSNEERPQHPSLPSQIYECAQGAEMPHEDPRAINGNSQYLARA